MLFKTGVLNLKHAFKFYIFIEIVDTIIFTALLFIILLFFKFHCLAPPTPVFPNQYGTIIEANIVEKNLTVTAQEYFDRDGNRAVLTMRQNNTVHDLVFDYSNDQLFYVTGW